MDVKRVFQDTEQIFQRTINNLEADAEFSLTFVEYNTGTYGNWTDLTTLQNLKPSILGTLNLKIEPRFEYGPTQPSGFPSVGFDPDDIINRSAYGFGYSGGLYRKTNVFYMDRRRNTTSELNTDLIYLPLFNNTLNEYSYLIEDWDLPAYNVLNKNKFTQDGMERRFYQTSLYRLGDSIRSYIKAIA